MSKLKKVKMKYVEHRTYVSEYVIELKEAEYLRIKESSYIQNKLKFEEAINIGGGQLSDEDLSEWSNSFTVDLVE